MSSYYIQKYFAILMAFSLTISAVNVQKYDFTLNCIHISQYCNSQRISPYTCYLICCTDNREIFSLNISFNHLVTYRFSDDEGSNGKRGHKKYGTVSQMGSFRVSRAISASLGYQSSPIAEKARDSQLLIGPGIVHASLAHRGCPL